ncbi:MAG: hypothetical protein AAGC86_18655 [Pseudomonadota bacterium]
MHDLKGFFQDERGAVSVEWVAVTFALMVGSIWFAYTLMAGGVAPVREEVNRDFNRVTIQPDGN